MASNKVNTIQLYLIFEDPNYFLFVTSSQTYALFNAWLYFKIFEYAKLSIYLQYSPYYNEHIGN